MLHPVGWRELFLRFSCPRFVSGLVLLGLSIVALPAATIRPIEHSIEYPIHLGGSTPEWSIFEGRRTHGTELRVKFDFDRNEREYTFFIRQDDVKQDWTVTLNGQKLGSLFLMEADLVHTLPIPAMLLREGENELHIRSKASDNILIHSLAIGDDSKERLLTAGSLTIRVTDASSNGDEIPARITIVDANGTLAAMQLSRTNFGNGSDVTSMNQAVRPGVVYSANGNVSVNLLPGTYRVFATRGPEYSLAQEEIIVGDGAKVLSMELEREVNTSGWISSDTHTHTLSLSKHGDALLNERAITLAAEGIEMPVATEHNLHADYSTVVSGLGLSKFLTLVPGNEVTTRKGHFNIFPISVEAKPPDHTIEHWPELIKQMRAPPGVEVVILNHPTDTHSAFTPFAATNFNRVTGRNLRGDFQFTFDAVEIINSGAMRSDWMEPIRAWFALLNRGYKIVGVGSSDSHDVSRFIVGQGRTYIEGDDSEPGRIDVARACESLKEGRAVVSLGLFTQLRISDAPDAIDAPQLSSGIWPAKAAAAGDLHQGSSRFFEAHGIVDFPRWINRRGRTVATLYANGRTKLVFPFDMRKQKGKPLGFKARFPKPKADTWYVLVADAPGMTNAYWSIARPYQPTSPEWNPAMIGVTNPIWLDADGDGQFTPPRTTAENLVKKFGTDELITALADYDWAVAVQVAEVLHLSGTNIETEEFQGKLRKSPLEIQQAFSDYMETISKK